MCKKLTAVFLASVLTLASFFFQTEKKAYALETYSTQKELRVSSSGVETLKVRTPKNLSGEILLHTWGKPDILVKYEKEIRASNVEKAKEFAQMVDVDLEKLEDEAELEINTPFRAPWEGKSYQVNLNLEFFVPEDLDLEAYTSNFDLAIYGPLKKVDLSSSYGKVVVEGVKENTQIKTAYGEVNVADINGEVDIETSYKPIRAERIDTKGRSAFLRTNHEKIEIEKFKGALEVETSYAPIIAKKLSLIDGENRLENLHSEIELEIDSFSSSELEIDNSFGDVNISLPPNSSFELSLSVGAGGKIHTRGLVITPKLIERTRLKGICGEGESLIEVFVNGIGEINLQGIEK